jgi:hypothetical protein
MTQHSHVPFEAARDSLRLVSEVRRDFDVEPDAWIWFLIRPIYPMERRSRD